MFVEEFESDTDDVRILDTWYFWECQQDVAPYSRTYTNVYTNPPEAPVRSGTEGAEEWEADGSGSREQGEGGSWAAVEDDLEDAQTWEVEWFNSIAMPAYSAVETFAGGLTLSPIDLSPVPDHPDEGLIPNDPPTFDPNTEYCYADCTESDSDASTPDP